MINPIGPVPTPLDSAADFNTKAFGLLAQLPSFVTETNATADTMQINADILAAVLLGMAFPEYAGTSTTSNSIGLGVKAFATQTGKLWTVGQTLVLTSGSNLMRATVLGYSGGALTVDVVSTVGSGTYSSWTIGLTLVGLQLARSGANADITSLTALSAGGLPDSSVTTPDIANLAVTAAKLADLSVTPQKLSGGQTGSAPAYAARAWCNADGAITGTNAPRAGGNVASVTFISAGVYDVTFVTQMPDANYVVVGTANGVSAGEDTNAIRPWNKTVNGFRVQVINGAATAYTTTACLQLVVFR